jgi:hypothetical protein
MRFMLRESEAKNGGGGIRRRRAGARSAQADVPRIAPHAFYAARERSQKRRRRDSTPQSRSAQRAGRCAANRSSCVLCCARAKPKTEEEGFEPDFPHLKKPSPHALLGESACFSDKMCFPFGSVWSLRPRGQFRLLMALYWHRVVCSSRPRPRHHLALVISRRPVRLGPLQAPGPPALCDGLRYSRPFGLRGLLPPQPHSRSRQRPRITLALLCYER